MHLVLPLEEIQGDAGKINLERIGYQLKESEKLGKQIHLRNNCVEKLSEIVQKALEICESYGISEDFL